MNARLSEGAGRTIPVLPMGEANWRIGQTNCRAVRDVVAAGCSTPARVARATGLSLTSAHSHLRHNLWDGHLVRLGSQYFRIEQRSTSA